MRNRLSFIGRTGRWLRRYTLWIWLTLSLIGLIGLIAANTALPLYKRHFQLGGLGLKELGYIYYGRAFLKPLMEDSYAILGNAVELVLDIEPQPQKSDLKAIHVKLPGGAIERMASSLPKSAKERYYQGELLYQDGVWRRARVRYRGRNLHHWMPEKPSLRIKLRKTYPVNMQRNINLINPEDRAMVSNPLGDWLARQLGVMTHQTEFVRLFINNDFFGVYHSTTRDDEEMIRINERMPGPLFVGDRVKGRWTPEKFEVAGEGKILEKSDPFALLTEAMYLPAAPDRYEKLWRIMDIERMAGWQAAMNLAGGIHTDSYHNHLYYFDPSGGKLEPLIVDINGFGLLTQPYGDLKIEKVSDYRIPINDHLQPLLNITLRDPHFYHRRNEILYQALNSGAGSRESLLAELDAIVQRTAPDIEADKRKASILRTKLVSFFRIPYSNRQYRQAIDNLEKWIENRYQFLEEHLKTAHVKVLVAPGEEGRNRFLVQVDGHVAVSFDPAFLDTKLFADTGLDGTFARPVDSPMMLYPGLREDTDLVYRWTSGKRRYQTPFQLVPDSQNYLFRTSGKLTLEALGDRLKEAFQHGLDHRPVTIELQRVNQLDAEHFPPNIHSVHSWRFQPLQSTTTRLGPGEVVITEDLFIPKNGRLEIAPGSVIRIQKGVSIVSEGPVTIAGSQEKPIYFQRADPEHAWGILAIQGRESSQSRISHAHFSGGSLASHLNIHYSGMVSVHWSPGFSMVDSSLRSNVESDDLLHVVHSDIVMERTRLESCYADCIDLDYAVGRLSNLTIRQAGNDGIDLMTSRFSIDHVDIETVEDKGFSVGEKSTVQIDQSRVHGANIGMAIKDASQAEVANSSLTGNFVAVDLARKNWRYGGPGRARMRSVRFDNNEVNVRSEERAALTFVNQAVPDKITGDGSVSRKQASGR